MFDELLSLRADSEDLSNRRQVKLLLRITNSDCEHSLFPITIEIRFSSDPFWFFRSILAESSRGTFSSLSCMAALCIFLH